MRDIVCKYTTTIDKALTKGLPTPRIGIALTHNRGRGLPALYSDCQSVERVRPVRTT